MSGTNHERLQIGSAEAIKLVAGRELRVRLRSKAFLIILAITALSFVALPIITKFAHSGPSTSKVAVVRSDAAYGRALESTATQLHQNVKITVVADPAAGRSAVQGGKVDAFVVHDASGAQVTVKKSLPDSLRTVFSLVDQQAALNAQITALGGDPAKVTAAVGSQQIQVTTLQHDDPQQGQKITIAIAAGLLMYMILMTVGQMVAQGVVEEKSSRVVELLLATIKPWQLLAGKVLGVAVIGALQLVVPGVLGLAIGMADGQLSVSLSASVGSLAWTLLWFAAGFWLYAMIFASAGAMVSRQEDLGGLMAPIIMPLVAGWVVAISILPTDPHSGVAEILSYVPLTAPELMPMRWALGVAPLWQMLVSLAITLACGVVMLRFAGRIYRNSVLRSGARVPLKEALKAA
ncbi:ABC transporter permease [Streptacidiphilus rugosus]|uniref:ABC transporter permease n=1 Tax=Streptacidiphilus rugosus TaxID=405783 RepID=UPI00068B09A4|nr:ABC transporter permease [Streptacidiphilus rugosus]